MDEQDLERIRQALRDEYWAAMTLYPMAMMDLAAVECMSDEELIHEAIRRRWIEM